MQVELLNRNRWKTRTEFANALFKYLESFRNRQGRHSSLGMLSPVEYELGNASRTAARIQPSGSRKARTHWSLRLADSSLGVADPACASSSSAPRVWGQGLGWGSRTLAARRCSQGKGEDIFHDCGRELPSPAAIRRSRHVPIRATSALALLNRCGSHRCFAAAVGWTPTCTW